MKIGKTVVIFLLIFCATEVSAEIYRYLNAKGELVYSQSPPPEGITATVIEASQNPGQTSKNNTLINQEQEEDALLDSRKNEEMAKSMDNCEITRSNQRLLKAASAETIFTDSKGNQISYTQQELDREIKASQEMEGIWCEK